MRAARLIAALVVVALMAGCATATHIEAQDRSVAPHALTPGQVQAIVNVAISTMTPLSVAAVEEKPRPGPMKAIRSASGRIEFCAFVYIGTRNILGTINRQLVVGTFPSATSTDGQFRAKWHSDGPGPHARCASLGIGLI